MVKKMVTVRNLAGLHLRPAGALCQIAMEFSCRVEFRHNNVTSNAKSVLSVLGSGVQCGDELEIICDGTDEEAALQAVVSGIENGLGE